jgi:hypothetical protein
MTESEHYSETLEGFLTRSDSGWFTQLPAVLRAHLARYPELEVQDLYKLLYQAARGSEHAAPDPEAVRLHLTGELAGMGAGPDDPLFDPLPPDGRLVRVHLRPYLRSGRDPEQLLQAFLRTAQEGRGSKEPLQGTLREALHLAEQEPFPFPVQAMIVFFMEMERKKYPAVHHSRVYRRLYRPAYRVAARSFLEAG